MLKKYPIYIKVPLNDTLSDITQVLAQAAAHTSLRPILTHTGPTYPPNRKHFMTGLRKMYTLFIFFLVTFYNNSLKKLMFMFLFNTAEHIGVHCLGHFCDMVKSNIRRCLKTACDIHVSETKLIYGLFLFFPKRPMK